MSERLGISIQNLMIDPQGRWTKLTPRAQRSGLWRWWLRRRGWTVAVGSHYAPVEADPETAARLIAEARQAIERLRAMSLERSRAEEADRDV